MVMTLRVATHYQTTFNFNTLDTSIMQSHHFNVTLINRVLTSGLYNLMQVDFVAIVEMRGLVWI